MIAVEGSDEEIGEAVVVEVSGGGAHAVVGEFEAGLFGRICELAVVVAEEFVRAGGGVALEEQDVEVAVVVVVDERDAGAHDFGHVEFALGTAGMGEREFDDGEPGIGRWLGAGDED